MNGANNVPRKRKNSRGINGGFIKLNNILTQNLYRLKEKQAKRKVTRAEEEKKLAERKKQEEERRQREIEEKKQKGWRFLCQVEQQKLILYDISDIEEKRLRLEEAEKKRQLMLQAMNAANKKGPNFTVTKRDGDVSSNCKKSSTGSLVCIMSH